MRYKPVLFKLNFPNKCFKNKIGDRLVWDLHGHVTYEDQPLERVYNGEKAEYGEAPWAVYIRQISLEMISGTSKVRRVYRGTCSGVLLTNEWVLTAATCFNDRSVNLY